MMKMGQIQVLNEIQEQLDLLDPDQDTQIIWGGDFNVIFDTNLDVDGGNTNLDADEGNPQLCDIFRVRYPLSKRYTSSKNLF